MQGLGHRGVHLQCVRTSDMIQLGPVGWRMVLSGLLAPGSEKVWQQGPGKKAAARPQAGRCAAGAAGYPRGVRG